jgi:hypothetical protein
MDTPLLAAGWFIVTAESTILRLLKFLSLKIRNPKLKYSPFYIAHSAFNTSSIISGHTS